MTTPLPPPALWHDQTTGHWKVLTKPDRPTYEAYYTAEQVQQARADLEAKNEKLREALSYAVAFKEGGSALAREALKETP